MNNIRKVVNWPFCTGNLYASLFKSKDVNYSMSITGCRTIFIKPDPDAIPTLTTHDLIEIFSKSMGKGDSSVYEYTPGGLKEHLDARRLLEVLLPRDQKELPPRRMRDSFTMINIPLSTDAVMRSRYITTGFSVRIGRLLEDLDCFGVYTCWRHLDNPRAAGKENPYSIVTGSLDSFNIIPNGFLLPHEDIRISGHVSWVGICSFEAIVQMEQKRNGQYLKVVDASVVCVARNSTNEASAFVNPLVGDTPEEEAFINWRKSMIPMSLPAPFYQQHFFNERFHQRKIAAQESLMKIPPNAEEMNMIHKMFSYTLNPAYMGWKAPQFHPNSKPMSSTVLKTLQVCHPEHRNNYNKIFGGFIMRLATELATASAFKHTNEQPLLVDIDTIVFRKAVEIGNMLQFRSIVGYVEDNYVHISISAKVLDSNKGTTELTNVFHYTFMSNFSGTRPIPRVIPNTYQEAMTYLDSRRHFKEMMNRSGRDK